MVLRLIEITQKIIVGKFFYSTDKEWDWKSYDRKHLSNRSLILHFNREMLIVISVCSRVSKQVSSLFVTEWSDGGHGD